MESEIDFASLCLFLTREERLRLFDVLCEAVQKRIPERVSQELKISKPNVYPFMKGREKRHVPNSETTAKIVGVLRQKGYDQAILPILKPAIERMLRKALIYENWKEGTERANNPFSGAEYRRLLRSLSTDLMHY